MARRQRNPAVFWKHVDGFPFYLWSKGIPTVEDIVSAPMFTIFVSPKEVQGELPLGEDAAPAFHYGLGPGTDLWFIANVSSREISMQPAMLVVKSGIVSRRWRAHAEPQLEDNLRGLLIRRPSDPTTEHVFVDDLEIHPFAIEAGYSLVKLPDERRPRDTDVNWGMYVLDKVHSQGGRSWYTQSPARRELLLAEAQAVIDDRSSSDAERDDAVGRMEALLQEKERSNPSAPKKKGWYPKALEKERGTALEVTERYIASVGGDRNHSDPGPGGAREALVGGFGGLPTYDEVARSMTAEGVPLSPEGYQYQLGHIALGVHRMIRWVNFGMPVYQLDQGTAAMLALTDVDRVRQGDVVLPYDSFLIVLEPGSPLYMDDQGHTREVRYIWVHRYEDELGRAWIQITPTTNFDGISLPTPFLVHPDAEVSRWLEKTQRAQQWGEQKVLDLDREAIAAAVRLVVSLSLHLSDKKPKAQKPRHKVDQRRFAKQGLPLPTDWVVAPISLPKEIQKDIRELGPRVMGKLTTRHVVRGHWKSQAHGPGRSLRKWIRIDPYWRGEGPAALSKTIRKNPGALSAVKSELLD